MKPLLPSTELLGSSKIEIHYQRPHFSEMYHITGVKSAVKLLRQYMHPKQIDLRESFWVILLSHANRVLGISEVAQGTSTGVQTNVKYIFQLALLTSSNAIILCHNHPSGNTNISARDIKETKKIQRLAKIMEVTVLDHLIITSESYTSFVQEGHL